MSDFGAFRNPERAKQLNVFEGLSSDGVEATDIDGLIEYHNKGYIIYEIKHENAEMPFGQRLAIERMIKDASSCGKSAIAMVVEHSVSDYSQPVAVRECRVRELYYGKERRWRKPKRAMTAGELTDVVIRGIDSGMM